VAALHTWASYAALGGLMIGNAAKRKFIGRVRLHAPGGVVTAHCNQESAGLAALHCCAGALLDRLAQQWPRLRVTHLHELPAGWIGKNYALYYGASNGSG